MLLPQCSAIVLFGGTIKLIGTAAEWGRFARLLQDPLREPVNRCSAARGMQTGFEVAKCVFEAESFNQIAGIAPENTNQRQAIFRVLNTDVSGVAPARPHRMSF